MVWFAHPPDAKPTPDPRAPQPPQALITAEVRVGSVNDETKVRTTVVEERTGPLLLQVTEGVYFGDPNTGSTRPCAVWFVFWDEILRSTIPLSEAPAGHPLA